MEVHAASKQGIDHFIKQAMEQSEARPTAPEFQDPIREFARASRVESLVRNWLTYPIEERRRLIKTNFNMIPRYMGDPASGRKGETDVEYETRMMERWRALNVIIQEESRAKAGNRSPEVAIGALKLLFPEHNWPAPVPVSQKV